MCEDLWAKVVPDDFDLLSNMASNPIKRLLENSKFTACVIGYSCTYYHWKIVLSLLQNKLTDIHAIYYYYKINLSLLQDVLNTRITQITGVLFTTVARKIR